MVYGHMLGQEKIVKQGEDGEKAMVHWLDGAGLSYLYIGQSKETFASLFSQNVKRPDFLVLFESLGLIAVDVKNYTPSNGEFTLNFEKEVKRVIAFERLFRVPVWYAYMAPGDYLFWYWISALRAIEVGTIRTKKASGEKFLAIKMDEFVTVEGNADLGKLYTQRMPGLGKVKNFPLG